jgi:ankyrin repeat protein
MGNIQSQSCTDDGSSNHEHFLSCLCSCDHGGQTSKVKKPLQKPEIPPFLSVVEHGPFLSVVEHGNLEYMKLLLVFDPNLPAKAKDYRGNTAAHVAARNGRIKERELLLLYALNEVRYTPAHCTAEKGQVPILQYFQ